MNPQDQEIGSSAADFSLPAIAGSQGTLATLLENRKGGVVVFWSGICSHCVRYDAYLNDFTACHPELGLTAIASRSGESAEQIQQTMAERALGFSMLYDGGGTTARQWAALQTPRAFLIGPDRKLLYRGAIDNFKYPNDPEYVGYLEAAIEDFLEGRPVRRAETPSFGCAIQSVYYNLPRSL